MSADEGTGVAPGRGDFVFDVRLLSSLDAEPAKREAEWRRVYEHFDPRLRSYFAGRVGEGDALDELLATLWRRALRGLPELQHAGSAWNWLIRVGLNALRDGWRREASRARRHEVWARDELDAVEDAPDAERGLPVSKSGVPPDIDVAAVLAELDNFPPTDREVLRMRLVEGLEHDDIAVRLGLPSGAAARQRFSRARQRLQARLRTPSHDDGGDR